MKYATWDDVKKVSDKLKQCPICKQGNICSNGKTCACCECSEKRIKDCPNINLCYDEEPHNDNPA